MKEWIKKVAGFQDLPDSGQEGQDDSQGQDDQAQEEFEAMAQEDSQGETVREDDEEKDRFLDRLKKKMSRSRKGFVHQIDELFLGKRQIDPELLDELEELLVMADMGVSTVQEILDDLRLQVERQQLSNPEALRQKLKEAIEDLFNKADKEAGDITWQPVPFVILVVGVNGVGKTTTIAKLAFQLKEQGKKVLLVAADTFRAAAVEQLEVWGKKIGVPVISHKSGSDPSAVAYDGIEAALARGMDVVIVDTAGRLHTQVNLMEELKKIKRVMGRKMEGAPHEVFLVLDATTGQNAVSQARMFCEATDVTGICLTKLDGTAKGGIVTSIVHQMKLPIRYIGIGERMEDLRPFDSKEFVEALFD